MISPTIALKENLVHGKVNKGALGFPYNHNISIQGASLVRDILMTPEATDPYTNLKTELINRSGESSQQAIRQLLSGEELGSRKPSELLRNMRRRGDTLKVR
ncbi:hypothetical protein AVEN_29616-1 [Araneus ventricosus]|uniref:DUF7041 domain-containing protein n=1 Tax=Araneus ventricosus TaxID=182803 RepID=A0A4Y2I8I1_ARAVE|nr:hypothetical protein AVEN_29616-1 [Araneus ventricosus]